MTAAVGHPPHGAPAGGVGCLDAGPSEATPPPTITPLPVSGPTSGPDPCPRLQPWLVVRLWPGRGRGGGQRVGVRVRFLEA